MSYDEIQKKSTMRYIKNKQRQFTIRFRKDDFESRISPAIKKSGLPIATFIKQAVDEKIARDGL